MITPLLTFPEESSLTDIFGLDVFGVNSIRCTMKYYEMYPEVHPNTAESDYALGVHKKMAKLLYLYDSHSSNERKF